MIDALAIAVTVGSASAAVTVLAMLVGGHYRWRRIAPTLLVLQFGVLVQALLDVIAMVAGHHPGEPVTHVAYLLASLVVLPAAAGQAGRDDGRWAAVLVSVTLLALAVIVIRMATTWRPDAA